MTGRSPSGIRRSRGRSGSQPPLGGSQLSRFERLPYFKPPALPEVSDCAWSSSTPAAQARRCLIPRRVSIYCDADEGSGELPRPGLNPPKGLDLLRPHPQRTSAGPFSLNPPKGLDLLRHGCREDFPADPSVSIPRRVSIYCDLGALGVSWNNLKSQSPEGSRSIATAGVRRR